MFGDLGECHPLAAGGERFDGPHSVRQRRDLIAIAAADVRSFCCAHCAHIWTP
jgi:hypothetical protein